MLLGVVDGFVHLPVVDFKNGRLTTGVRKFNKGFLKNRYPVCVI